MELSNIQFLFKITNNFRDSSSLRTTIIILNFSSNPKLIITDQRSKLDSFLQINLVFSKSN